MPSVCFPWLQGARNLTTVNRVTWRSRDEVKYSKIQSIQERHKTLLVAFKLSALVLIYIDNDKLERAWQLFVFSFLAGDTGIANEREISTSQTSFTEDVLQLELETLKIEKQELITELEDLKTKEACAAGGNVAVCDVKNGAEQCTLK